MKNILITGASTGLGKALAIEYAEKDTNLYLISRNQEKLQETVKLCEEKHSSVNIKILDVSNRKEMKEYLQGLNICFDLVIANAGVSGGTAGGFFEDYENVYRIFDTNIYGVVNTITPLLPIMVENKKGQIAIISSMASFRGMPMAPAYSASKGCVRYYGEALNNHLKEYNVKVSVVCPGFVKTNMTSVNDFPMPFMMTAEKASKKIKKGLLKNKKFIIFPKIVYFAIKFLEIITFGFNDWFYSRLPKKK